jgi:cytoskeletal protein CcmA (bactofilin family)
MCEPRCTFSITPDAWAATTGIPCSIDDDLLEGESWRCPRTKADENHCVFHQPASETSAQQLHSELRDAANGTPTDTAIADTALSDTPTDRERARLATQLMGTRATQLDLRDDRVDANGTQPLDLRCSEIETVAFSGVALTRPLDLRGLRGTTVGLTDATITGDCRLDYARLEGTLDVAAATVDGRLTGRHATVARVDATAIDVQTHVDWRHLTVNGGVDIRGGRVDGRLRCRFATVDGDFDGSRVRLTGETPYEQIHQLSCKALTTTGSIVFDGAVVDGAVRLNDAQADGDLTITDATLRSHLWLGAVDSEHGRSGSADVEGSIKLSGTTVSGELDLAGAGNRTGTLQPPTVGGTVDLSGTVVDGPAYLEPDLSDSQIDVVDASAATLAAGVIAQATPAQPVVYDLSRATVGDCQFAVPDDATLSDGDPPVWRRLFARDAESEEFVPLRHVRLLETEFDGFDFAWHRRQVEAQSWTLHQTSCSIAAVARSRHYDSAVRYARDAVALFEAYPDARTFVAGHDPDDWALEEGQEAVPFDADAVASHIFGARDAVPDLSEKTQHEVLPAVIGTREYSRMGLVTRLLRHYTDGIDHQLVDVFETRATATALVELAVAVETRDSDDTATVHAAVAALAASITDLMAEPAAHDPQPSTLESTYLQARNGADNRGDSTAAGEFYIQELRQRRRQHWRRIWSNGGDSLGAAVDFVSNGLFDLAAGYGERPRNVFAVAIVLVVVFTGIFGLAMDEPPYGWAAGYLILSLESFVTLVLGGADTVPSTIRLIAQIEGFLGGFLIALFVFTLTRSVDR